MVRADSVNQISISASLEDYLEAIFRIIQKKRVARAKDIGKRLNVSRSSVTGALQALAGKSLINYAPYDVVTLTDEGRVLAREVARRHEILKDFFVQILSVEEADAEATACKMEHAISDTVFQRFLEFVEFLERCPRAGSQWIKEFGRYCDSGKDTGNCEACVGAVLNDVRNRKKSMADDARKTDVASLEPGERAFVAEINGSDRIRQKLSTMGVTPGAMLEIERVALPEGAVGLKIKGYHLTLSLEEAKEILVELT